MYTRALINKSTVSFIRNNTGVSYEYIERTTKFSKQHILQWENCTDPSLPTINQAKKLAKCFRTPFAGLYMKAEDINIKQLPRIKNMRTIQNAMSHDDSALNLAIIDLLNARELLLEAKTELKEPITPFTLSIAGNNVIEWSNAIRVLFNLDLEKQYNLTSTRKLYLYFRNQIEKKDVFIHCFTGVDTVTARGLAIYKETMPIIGINDEDRYPAKTFSIIHELVHVFRRNSSMCNDFYNSFSASKEEVFCNAIAGEVLVPQEALRIMLKNSNDDITIDKIGILADRFSVSKEVIIRRLLDHNYINKVQYTSFANEFKKLFDLDKEAEKEKRKATGKKGIPRNMPMEIIDKTSSSLIKTLYHGVGEGLFDKQDISRYLGIGQKHINKIMQEVSKWDK